MSLLPEIPNLTLFLHLAHSTSSLSTWARLHVAGLFKGLDITDITFYQFTPPACPSLFSRYTKLSHLKALVLAVLHLKCSFLGPQCVWLL